MRAHWGHPAIAVEVDSLEKEGCDGGVPLMCDCGVKNASLESRTLQNASRAVTGTFRDSKAVCEELLLVEKE